MAPFRARVLAAAASLGVACSSATLPPRASLREPVTVYLLQTPIHPVLALPDERGRYFGYGFGDRTYMSTFDWRESFLAAGLFFAGIPGQFTSGAIERLPLRGTTGEALAAELGMDAVEFDVERSAADSLRADLDARLGEQVETWGLYATDDHYSLWWDNCHTKIAIWLRALGAEVPAFRLVPRWAGWSLRESS